MKFECFPLQPKKKKTYKWRHPEPNLIALVSTFNQKYSPNKMVSFEYAFYLFT